MLLAEAMDRFQVQLEADGRSSHTRHQYRRHLRVFAAWLATGRETPPEVDVVTPEAVARFLAAPVARLCANGTAKKATTANAIRTSVRVFTAYLHKAGYLSQDPGRLVRRAFTSGGPPKALSVNETDRLLATLEAAGTEGERDFVLFHLLLATGIRLSAALGLRADDVDLAAGDIQIRTKGDRIERVLLAPKIREHLEAYLSTHSAGFLFPGHGEAPITRRHAHRLLRGWLKRAGIDRALSPHSLRHSFATTLYARTHDIALVQSALGHKSIASTLVYAKTNRDQLRAALA